MLEQSEWGLLPVDRAPREQLFGERDMGLTCPKTEYLPLKSRTGPRKVRMPDGRV